MNRWIDTHTHLDIIEKQESQQIKVVEESHEKKIERLITISTTIESYLSGKNLVNKFPDIVYTTCGLYPSHAEAYDDNMRNQLIAQLKEGVAVAIGEAGIDYHWNYATPDLQKKLFRDQIHLAKEFDLPLVIHARNSYDDIYAIIKEEKPSKGGVMHCYSSDVSYVDKFVELGLYISFAGNVTYKKAHTLQESCVATPLERLVLETDAPYLTPMPFRGKKNYPHLISNTAEFVAELKGVSLEKLSEATCQNAIDLFNLNGD